MKTVSKFGSEEKEGKVVPNFVENFSSEEAEPEQAFFTPEKHSHIKSNFIRILSRYISNLILLDTLANVTSLHIDRVHLALFLAHTHVL